MVVFVMAAVCLVAKAIRPYREASVQSRQLVRTERRVASLDVQNAELRRRIALLKTPGGIVTEARMMGYLKPGEIPFVVENTGSQAAPMGAALDAAAPAPTPPKPHSPLRGLLRRLTGR